MRTREEDFLTHLFVASTHAYILIFSDRGRVYWLKVARDPGRRTRGARQGDRQPGEDGARRADRGTAGRAGMAEADGERFVAMGTRKGIVKQTDLRAFRHPRAGRNHRDGGWPGRCGHRR